MTNHKNQNRQNIVTTATMLKPKTTPIINIDILTNNNGSNNGDNQQQIAIPQPLFIFNQTEQQPNNNNNNDYKHQWLQT